MAFKFLCMLRIDLGEKWKGGRGLRYVMVRSASVGRWEDNLHPMILYVMYPMMQLLFKCKV